jgi:RNA polymerase sigma factor
MNDLDKRILIAQNIAKERENIINEYLPFIKSTVSSYLTEKVQFLYDDVISIGCIAFNEAITKYQIDKGSFLTFSKYVMRNRIYDFLSSNNTYISNNYISSDEEEVNNIIDINAKKMYEQHKQVTLRRLEIEQYKEQLLEYDLSMELLVNNSPRQKRTRETYKKVAMCIINNDDLISYLERNKRLPIKKICEIMKLPRKKLGGH